MKKALTFFIFLLVSKISACSCLTPSLIELTAKADFIATANILDISKDTKNGEFHNVQIEILELFKGPKLHSLKIYSNSNSTCAFFTPKSTKWLIFAYEGENGQLSFGYCSGSKQLDKYDSKIYQRYPTAKIDKAKSNYNKSLNLKIELLRFLKNNNIKPNNDFGLQTYFITDCLNELKGFKVKNEPFALYELFVGKDLKIEKLNVLKAFDNEALTLQIESCLMEGITIRISEKEKKIPNKTKITLGLYYYINGDRTTSIISKYAL